MSFRGVNINNGGNIVGFYRDLWLFPHSSREGYDPANTNALESQGWADDCPQGLMTMKMAQDYEYAITTRTSMHDWASDHSHQR